MTIIASVKVRDGLILGTDSMTQIQASDETSKPNFPYLEHNERSLA